MKSVINELHFEEIDSTSSFLKREYLNLTNFTFVSSDYQTRGKGRLSRQWISDKFTNLLFSFLIKDKKIIDNFAKLSLISALSIAEILIDYKINDVSIKWPNDVYINGKKVCGILLEGQVPDYLIVGIGLNVNQKVFPTDLAHPITSMAISLSKEINIQELKQKVYSRILENMDYIYKDDNSFLNKIRAMNYLLNKEVFAIINNEKTLVKVIDINEDCSLKVEVDGKTINLNSDEISFHY